MKPNKPIEKNTMWEERIIPLVDPMPHEHYFEFVGSGECKCRKCGFGLIGVVDLVDGKPR